MPTDEDAGITRMRKVQEIVDGLRSAYPDAKKFSVDIQFEWVETDVYSDGAELCPSVQINIER
jgi:hypothetical protein